METQTTLILLAHGSRDPRWREPFEELQRETRQRLNQEPSVLLAYMEFSEPTLASVVGGAYAKGIRKIKILPLFMAAGAHLSTDVPAQIAELTRRYEGLNLEAMAPVGEHPGVREALIGVIRDAVNP